MNCKNFGGRGRGFGPRGAFRPRFPGPPFRHAGPPRPGCPPPGVLPPGVRPPGMPWRPNVRFFPPHMLRGNPQFRPAGGRKKRFFSYDVRFPAPNTLPVPPEYEETAGYEAMPPYWQAPEQCDQVEAMPPPQPPPLGSEEERQQKIAETADRLKQKLSCFNKSEMTNIWTDDVSSTEDNIYAENTNIPLHRYESSELSLTNSDLKDIGKINPAAIDSLQYDGAQHLTDVFDVDVNRDVMTLDENNDGSQVEMMMFDGAHQVATNLVNLHGADDDYVEMNEGEQLADAVLEQSDFAHQDIHVESETLESNVQCYNIPLVNMSPDQYEQQQPLDQYEQQPPGQYEQQPPDQYEQQPPDQYEQQPPDQYEQQPLDMSQETLLPFDTANQESLHDCLEEPVTNLEFHEDDGCALLPTIGSKIPVLNNATTDSRSPQESFLRGGPPDLSPHIEQELPVDFDPTTPPPTLLKQDQSYALPPPLPDLPLFNPAEPPPNMRHLEPPVIPPVIPPHESANAAWSNPLPAVPAVVPIVSYGGMEVHGGFAPQQLSLDLPGQSNIFMPPPIETINYVAPFVPPCNNTIIGASIPPVLPLSQMPPPMVPPKTFPPPSSPPPPEPPPPPPPSDDYCNKDEVLNDLQEAMKFAMEMTEITERNDGKSNEDLAATGDINSIALPPGMPTLKTGKKKEKKKRKDSTHKQLMLPEQVTPSQLPPSEDATVAAQQDANAIANALAIELDRPKVVFNLNNKTKIVNVEWTDTVSETTKTEKKNGMMQSDAKKAALVRKNLEAASTRSREEERISRRHESNLENTRGREEERTLRKHESTSESASARSREEERTSRRLEGNPEKMESSRNQKKAPRGEGVHASSERSHHPFLPVSPRVNLQKSRSRTARSESSSSSSSSSEASWKNKIISRFLKMSKNDIYNMVNNTSLRKFDIIMKRLVKEKKHTLSLEMRHAQDEKMKLYDQQEFMKQLNDMLDSDTIESITDLPTEFIHHLNEVLQLDMQFDTHDEPILMAAASSGHAEQPAIYTPAAEYASVRTVVPASGSVDQEPARGKSHDRSATAHGGALKARHDKDAAPASATAHVGATKARHDKDAAPASATAHVGATKARYDKDVASASVTKARHDKDAAPASVTVDQELARNKSHDRSATKARHDKEAAPTSGAVDQELARNKGHDRSTTAHGGATKARHDKEAAPACGVKNSELSALRGEAVFSTAACASPNTKLLTLQHAVDDIFSEVTKKIQKEVPAATKERKGLGAPQRGAKKLIDESSALQKNTPPRKELLLAVEDDRTRRLESSPRWLENKWKRKEREDPRAYRNLTKEEWEAKYGAQASLLTVTTTMSPSASTVTRKVVDPAAAVAVASEKGTLRARARGRKILPRRRHSSESSRQSNTRRSRPLEKDKHKESRRHSDDRQHTAGYTTQEAVVVTRLVRESKSKSSSRHSSTSSISKSSTSSSSNDRDNVTKLLREIKEKEKVAKQMSLNETIRDEVNAEIERERKQKSKRKSRKNSKNRKEKRLHHKKKKRKKSKKAVSSSESTSDDEDNNEASLDRLLTESEIKKENEEMQQVIIKEEFDIGQESIVGSAELAANISAGCALVAAQSAPCGPSETPQPPPPPLPPRPNPPPPPSQESTTTSVVSSAQSHPEDRIPPSASPTQPKTKAQLKQMPEAASDLNDNRVSLNVFTSLPKDWKDKIHPAIIAACVESDSVTDGARDKRTQEASLPAAVDDSAAPGSGEFTECATSQRQIPLIASQPSGTINTRRDNETPVSNDVSNKASTVSAASATAAAANGSPAVAKQQGGSSKKIDIKTYYERRMNGQGELKRIAESPPAAPTEAPPAKTARREITIERTVAFTEAKIDASRSGSSIRDPRLISQSQKLAAAAVAAAESKQIAKESRAEVATSRSRPPSAVIKASSTEGANATSTGVAAPSKLGENSTTVATPSMTTRRKLQRNFPPDSKRFQNIRSEGSKELKLKKESGGGGGGGGNGNGVATQKKPRSKRKTAPESIGLISPTTNAKNAETIVKERRGSSDSIGSSSEADVERRTAPRDDKADNSGHAECEKMLVISLRRITDNSERDKPSRKHISSKSSEISSPEETAEEKTAASNSVEREAEVCGAERAKDDASVVAAGKDAEGEENAASEISHVAVPITPEISDISHGNIATEEPPLSASTPIVAPSVVDDVVAASDSIALEESVVSAIPELNLSGLVDGIVTDAQGKADQLLIISACIVSRDLEIGATKGNNIMKADTSDGGASCGGGRASEGDSEPPPLGSSGITSRVVAACPRMPATTTVSNESSQERQGNGVVSPGSVGSPFKGFLQEAAAATVDFAQPGLFSFELTDLVDDGKNRDPLDHCSLLDCTATATGHHKVVEVRIDGLRRDPGMLVDVVDPNSVNMAEHGFGVLTFDDTLLASDKECERNDRSSGFTVNEEETARAIVAPNDDDDDGDGDGDDDDDVVGDDNNGVNTGGEGGEGTMNEVRYASSAELASMKESMFINEEEIIQDEARHMRDLTSKLKTTADPSLTDAIDHATISDDALRLSVGQVGAEPLNNHLYLEAHVSPGTGKAPDYDDEHLDENMFYLDERLQSAAAFEVAHKVEVDDASVVVGHFAGMEPEQESPTYEIGPAVTPETAMLIAGLGDKERCEFDFTKHIPPASAGDMLAVETPTIECASAASPSLSRTLNVPTKAALKEAVTNLFLKSAPDGATITAAAPESEMSPSVALGGLFEKTTPHSGADLNYQTMAWNINTPANLQAQNETCVAREFVNTNGSCAAAAKEIDGHCRGDLVGEHSRDKIANTSSSRHTESDFSNNARRNPDIVSRDIKESTVAPMERKAHKSPEKVRDAGVAGVKDRKRRKDRDSLHDLRDKRRMKGSRSRNNDVAKKLKDLKRSRTPSTRDGILARMLEIDIEIHKLMMEKLELHERLQRTSPAESGSATLPKTTESIVPAFPPPSLPPSTMLSMLRTVTPDESNRAKPQQRDNKHHSSASKHSPAKQRKRIASHSSEDDEIVRSMQKKMPVIKWKKTPRLEMTRRGEEEDDYEEEDEEDRKDAKTTPSGKKADGSPAKTRKSESDPRAQKDAARKIDKSKRSDSTLEHLNHDKKNEISVTTPSKATAKANSQITGMSAPVHSTPESLSIYSDDSTWDSLVQNTVSEVHENKKATGLVLLDEKLKQEHAKARKFTTIVRKRKKQQLDSYLKSVNSLTRQEENLPLSKLYIKKLRQQRDLLLTLSQKKKEPTNSAVEVVEAAILRNMEEVINAVAENRVYEPRSAEARTSPALDVPTASNAVVPQVVSEDKHQFYVDVEANANSDWPCREKEDIVEVAVTAGSQQNNNDAAGDADGSSNHVFKAVNEDKSFYSERDTEPGGNAIPPAETLTEKSCSSDANNLIPRIFDIKVSVPKILIKDGEFDRRLLIPPKDKDKDKESGAADTVSVESTTLPNAEKSEEEKHSSDAPSVLQIDLDPTEKEEIDLRQENKREEEEEESEKRGKTEEEEVQVIEKDASSEPQQEPEKIDGAADAPQLDAAKFGYSDVIGNEDTRDSVASNRCDKTTVEDATINADPVAKKVDPTPDDVECELLSSDTTLSRQDDRHAKSLTPIREEQKTDAEVVAPQIAFERIMDSEHSTVFSSVPPSEKSEESNEQRSDAEHTSTAVFSFNKTADLRKSSKETKRSRRRHEQLPVRRSTRYSNENVKPRFNDIHDSNSNSSEQESSVLERDASGHGQSSKSPSWAMRDERSNVLVNNIRRNRAQKEQKVTVAEDPRSNFAAAIGAEPTAVGGIKRKAPHTEWQIRNCKVRLIDCKHTFLKQNVGAGVLSKFGIVAVNRHHVSSDISHAQRVARNPDIPPPPPPPPVNPIAVAKKVTSSLLSPAETSCDGIKEEVEILEARVISEKSSDLDVVSESASYATETTTIDDEQRTQYTVHKGPILDIKVHETSFLAASEDGKIYRYSQTSNGILNIYKGHKSAVTCLYIYKSDVGGNKTEFMFSGSLDGTLRCYNITTGALMKTPANISSPIQCMDQAWGIIYVGTKSGHVSRFHIKPGVIKGSSIEFSEKSVLALKATNEGPRRILIVASRNLPITIRDAQTGLFLRTISSQNNHTVYSLMRHNNLIYCGTSSTSINVFDFTTGEQRIQYDAGVGIVCMRLYEQLLFAGCYDGNIYVFDTRNHKLVCSIPGPGNMLLSVEVVNNKIIAGSKDKRLHSWQMPIQVRALL